MQNNKNESLKNVISLALNDWLDYVNSNELRLVTIEFNLCDAIDDRHDLVQHLDAILAFCNADLYNSIKVLTFINNYYS